MNNILDGLDYQRFLNYLPEDKRHWFLIYLCDSEFYSNDDDLRFHTKMVEFFKKIQNTVKNQWIVLKEFLCMMTKGWGI